MAYFKARCYGYLIANVCQPWTKTRYFSFIAKQYPKSLYEKSGGVISTPGDTSMQAEVDPHACAVLVAAKIGYHLKQFM
jgi:hypothetical protein